MSDRLIALHEEQAWARHRSTSADTDQAARAAVYRASLIEEAITNRLRCCAVSMAPCAGLYSVATVVDGLDKSIPKFRPNRLLDTGVWQYPVLGFPEVVDGLGIRAQLTAALHHDVGIDRSGLYRAGGGR